jgi:hypothetical protein
MNKLTKQLKGKTFRNVDKLIRGPVVAARTFYRTQQSVSLPSHEDGDRSSSRKVVFSRIPDDGQSPESQWFWVLCTTVRTLQILLIAGYSASYLRIKIILMITTVKSSSVVLSYKGLLSYGTV